MLIAGVDTSGKHGGLALARGTKEAFEVLETVSLMGGTYSARLIPELAGLLERQGLTKRDLEGFAVVSGPGSFTGLRVGLSTVKALAEILQRPIAAVSALEAIAAQTNHDGPTIAALDAARNEVFAGEYNIVGGEAKLRAESLLTYAEFTALLDRKPAAELVTPHETAGNLARMHLHVKQIDWPDAGEIARLGYQKIVAGQTVSPEHLEANYIRRSDAEIFYRS